MTITIYINEEPTRLHTKIWVDNVATQREVAHAQHLIDAINAALKSTPAANDYTLGTSYTRVFPLKQNQDHGRN